MKVNSHLFQAVNYGYHHSKMHAQGINLTTEKRFKEVQHKAHGTEYYNDYVEQCNDLVKSAIIECDFWIRINERVFPHSDVDQEFQASFYTIMELLSMINEIVMVKSYKREECEAHILSACINTVESRIDGLQGVLGAIEAKKFLTEETYFIWNSWGT